MQINSMAANIISNDLEKVLRWDRRGLVAKKLDSRYRPGERGWIKLKNPNYWRRDAEREAMQGRASARRSVALHVHSRRGGDEVEIRRFQEADLDAVLDLSLCAWERLRLAP